jgi:hypothetical protein
VNEALEKHLPAPPAAVRASASDVRQRLLQLVTNAVAADHTDRCLRAERGEELSEADRLRLRLAQLEEKQPIVEPEESAVQSGALAEALARIEQLEDEARHLRGTKPRRLPAPSEKPLKPVAKTAPTADANASKSDAKASSGAKPPPASSSPSSTPSPARPSEPAWRSWYYNGGGDTSGTFGPTPWSDNQSAGGWLSRLNSRAW